MGANQCQIVVQSFTGQYSAVLGFTKLYLAVVFGGVHAGAVPHLHGGGARMTSTRAVTSTQAGGGGVPLALLLCTELLLLWQTSQ